MSNTKKAIHRLAGIPIREAAPAALVFASLRDLGWHNSVRKGAPVDLQGQSLPWWTYSAIDWLGLALGRHHSVFEFGSGGSTLWLAERVREVHSVEHDATWVNKVRPRLPSNARLSVVDPSSESATAETCAYLAPLLEADRRWDLIVVDGLMRNECVRASIERLTDKGILLLDDADRPGYSPAHEALSAAGFGRLDFGGLKPGVGHLSTTCLFSRDFNPWTRELDVPRVSGY